MVRLRERSKKGKKSSWPKKNTSEVRLIDRLKLLSRREGALGLSEKSF